MTTAPISSRSLTKAGGPRLDNPPVHPVEFRDQTSEPTEYPHSRYPVLSVPRSSSPFTAQISKVGARKPERRFQKRAIPRSELCYAKSSSEADKRGIRTESFDGKRAIARRSIAISTAVVAVATLVTKIISLVREWLMASLFATSLKADAWFMASVVPNRLFAAVDSGLSNVLVPTLSGVDQRYGESDINHFLQESLTLVTLASLGLMAVGYAFTRPLVEVLAPGFSGVKLALTIALARIMLPTIPLWALNGFLVGVLRSREAFTESSIASIVTSVLRVASFPVLVIAFGLGVHGVAIGFTVAVMAQTIYLLATVLRLGVRLKLRWGLRHPLTKRMFRLSPPFLLSSTVTTLGVLVDRILASGLVTGSIAALNYSQVLSQLPSQVLLQSFAQPIFTRLSAHWNADQHAEYDELLARGFILVAAVAVPVTLTFIWLGGPILQAVYEHGRFSPHSRMLTLGPLVAWSAGIPAAGYGTYLSRALFAQQKTRAITRISLLVVGCNIAGDLLLIRPLAATGLALATSLAWWLRATLLAVHVRRGAGPMERPLVDLTKLGWLGLAMVAFSAILLGLPPLLGLTAASRGLTVILQVGTVIAAGWIFYAVALVLLPIMDARDQDRLRRAVRRVTRPTHR